MRSMDQLLSTRSNQIPVTRSRLPSSSTWVHHPLYVTGLCADPNFLQYLERRAALQGETGVAISLSKPFQRLLKYPLLFQNLLFHTDPSTFEYESTLQMVSEVETIVRSIEDEKIQKEERDKTRDAIARIDGLEKEKVSCITLALYTLTHLLPFRSSLYSSLLG
jgi:RhoGEF domain